MTTPARKSATTKELLRHVAQRSTGKLSLGEEEWPFEVFLMNGDIIGAVSPQDDSLLLRRIRHTNSLDTERLESLEKVASAGQSIFGQLLDEVESTVIEPILTERFRDNLTAFVASGHGPHFEAQMGVFVDNMQMGQNSARLIDTACKEADRAISVQLSTAVVLGSTEPRDEFESAVARHASTTPVPVALLLELAPVEPWTGRALVASMLDSGALADPSVQLSNLDVAPVQLDEAEDDEPTVEVENVLLEAEDFEEIEEIEEIADSEPDESPVSPVDSGDMAKWLDNGDHISEEDLAFFEDHEHDRGAGEGGFSTEMHNLDRVDVGGEEHEVLEADEAPSAKFSAPVLSEHDALEKIEVANDVLRRVTTAFDAASGHGRGRSQIQLLVDGAPSKYTALLHDLTITEAGELPAEDLLDNLAGRPPSEHRQLINSALKNVIERALSSAADDLPEDSFDDVYESVAGYNKRLGL